MFEGLRAEDSCDDRVLVAFEGFTVHHSSNELKLGYDANNTDTFRTLRLIANACKSIEGSHSQPVFPARWFHRPLLYFFCK
jgi:hypothetical protein